MMKSLMINVDNLYIYVYRLFFIEVQKFGISKIFYVLKSIKLLKKYIMKY